MLGICKTVFFSIEVHEWIKTLARTVRFAWARDEDRGLIVDEDRIKIDAMVVSLCNKAINEDFENDNEGLRHAMREFWLLGHTIDYARLK